jgi:hypothetical protein
MKIKIDPALKSAFTYLAAYFGKTSIIKYLIIYPLRFIFKKSGSVFIFSKLLKNFRILRTLYKLFSTFNLMLIGFILIAINDFNIENILIYIAIFYSRILDFINNNILGYFINKFKLVINKILESLNIDIDRVKDKINILENEAEADTSPKIDTFSFRTKYKYFNSDDNNLDYTFSEESPVEGKKAFFSSPYFYIPFGLVITGITIYFCYDSLPTLAAILTALGINDDDGPTPPSKPSAPAISSSAPEAPETIEWMKDSKPKSFNNAFTEVVNTPSSSNDPSIPSTRLSSSFEDKLKGIFKYDVWTRPESPDLSDSSSSSSSVYTSSTSSSSSTVGPLSLYKGKRKSD